MSWLKLQKAEESTTDDMDFADAKMILRQRAREPVPSSLKMPLDEFARYSGFFNIREIRVIRG